MRSKNSTNNLFNYDCLNKIVSSLISIICRIVFYFRALFKYCENINLKGNS